MRRLLIQQAGQGSSGPRNNTGLELRSGEALPVFASSGSGTSALFRCIVNAALGRGGGTSPYVVEFGFRSERPGRLGAIFDDASWSFCNLRVDEEIAFVLENAAVDPADMPAIVEAALEDVGLAGFGNRRISTLSGGELRKVALAAVLVGEPDLLLSNDLDGHLDLDAFDHLESILQRYIKTSGAAWLDFRRRWREFGPPGEVYGTLDNRRLSGHLGGSLQGISSAIGTPFGAALAQHLSIELKRDVPAFFSPTDAVAWAVRENLTFHAAPSPAPTQSPLLSASGLRFGYDASKPLLRNCDLALRRGTVYALGGRNGAGKSTLARILCGLLPPARGRISLGSNRASRSRLRRSGSLVFQKPEYQFLTDTVEDELMLAGNDGKLDAPPPGPVDVLEAFDLAHLRMHHPFSLGIGEKRRLSVACAMASGRDFIIIDEPTLGQDERQTRLLGSHLRQAAHAGRAVLVITHDPEFIAATCDEVLWLAHGVIRSLGAPSDAFSTSSGTMFAGRSHLLRFWEVARREGVAMGDPPRALSELVTSSD